MKPRGFTVRLPCDLQANSRSVKKMNKIVKVIDANKHGRHEKIWWQILHIMSTRTMAGLPAEHNSLH